MTNVTSKKRSYGEITREGVSSGNKSRAIPGEPDKTIWIEKHAPKTIDELAVNKKKVKEFIEIAEDNGGGGFLVLFGPPGSCKNALINTYCT